MDEPEAGRTRATWSLSRRLVAGFVALLAVLAVAIGGVTAAASHGQLVARLDRLLLDASERTTTAVEGGVVGPGSIVEILPGQGAGAIGIVSLDGELIRAGYVGVDGRPEILTVRQLDALLAIPADRTPHTVALGGTLGSYRVVATPIADTGYSVLNGLSLAEAEATTSQLVTTIAAVSIAAIILAVLLGSLVVRVALRPLTRVVETATRVSELPLESGEVLLAERVPEAPTTEVGRVGAALNRLLGKVENSLAIRHASEQKVRRFVADASHELRTPLASIRGYAELGRREADTLPTDVGRALERIESESIRMGALVEDMLLLARLDAGRGLRREPVGLGILLAEAVADAHVAGPDHEWLLDLPEEELEIVGDSDALRQVVANLLGNARRHTPPGTVVRASLVERDGGTERDGGVVLAVEDDGPGIPPDLVPTLFERFTRGDDARSRGGADGGAGTGLGLAIVAAIVEAHGGAVCVESRPGRTRFEILLPPSAASVAE